MNRSQTDWLRGIVVRGSGRGKQLGFPTANLRLADKDRPASGVYACWVKIGEEKQPFRGALHSGPRPTFGEEDSTVEIHLLDWAARDLYGESVSFQCVARVRAVRAFADPAELSAAMAEDCQKARAILG